MLREGDELLEVNGISVMGKRTDEIIRLMVRPDKTKVSRVVSFIERLSLSRRVLYLELRTYVHML